MSSTEFSSDAFKFLETANYPSGDAAGARAFVRNYGDTRWTSNNTSFYGYDRVTFFAERDASLRDIVEEQIGYDDNNVGLDLAGGTNGRALQDLLSWGILGKALVTNYEDLRDERTRGNEKLDHVDGDLLQRETWERIISWQRANAPDGLALIMHRPVGGLQLLPPSVYRKATHVLLDMIRPGGMMFAQVPKSLERGVGRYHKGVICEGIKRRPDIAEVLESPSFAASNGRLLIEHVIITKKS